MKAKPMGMLWMAPAGWLDDLPGAASHSLEALPERYLTHGMNICTLLDDAVRGFRGAAATRWGSETDRQRRPAGLCNPGDERRHLFGAGGDPTEAKQDAWNGSTQAGVRHKMRNNDLRFGYGHASATLRSAS